MEEIIVNDQVITSNTNDSNDKQPDTSGSFFVGPDLQNLLNLFVRQSKENEELTEVSSVEISEVDISEGITLYSDKTDSSMNGLLSQRPCAPPVPQHIVKMMMPLDFGTETPGDDLLATVVTGSVGDTRPDSDGEISPSARRVVGEISPGQEVVGHPRWVKEK